MWAGYARGRRLPTLGLVTVLAWTGCEEKPARDSGGRVGAAVADTATLKRAEATAGQVVRSSDDCEAVRRLVPQARAALDEADRQVQTAVGRQAIEGLRKRVRGIAGACGVP